MAVAVFPAFVLTVHLCLMTVKQLNCSNTGLCPTRFESHKFHNVSTEFKVT